MGEGEGRTGTVRAWRISFIKKYLAFMAVLFMNGGA